jgi:hypothetical protein
MRYRQDVPADLGPEAMSTVMTHIAEHLAGAVAPDDDPQHGRHEIQLSVTPHPDFAADVLCVVGEIDGEPDAPYLRPDFDPTADHPDIMFLPYENPAAGQWSDFDAFRRFWETR